MTGNELNYAFQQTVSSEYTFGSDDKLIDSFPSWPDMKRKYSFNPYTKISMSYVIDDESFSIEEEQKALIEDSIDTSFNSSEYTQIDVKLRVCATHNFVNGSSPFYYNGKEYLGSDVLFDVRIHIENKNVPLVFKGSDMVYDNDEGFVYEKTINVNADDVKRKLYYYSPENYMKLCTSEGRVKLNNRTTEFYAYI